MKPKFTLEVKSKIPSFTTEMGKKLDQVIRSSAFALQQRAALHTLRVDTSAMRSGWSVVAHGVQDYATVSVKAKALSPKGKQFPAPTEWVKPLEAWVVNVMEYAIWHEFGTRKMSAEPMLGPALAEVRSHFEKAVKDALGG